MRTREIACIHYVCENECRLGKDATFYKHCQICKNYKPLKGSKPARTDNRKQKEERRMRKEKWDY